MLSHVKLVDQNLTEEDTTEDLSSLTHFKSGVIIRPDGNAGTIL